MYNGEGDQFYMKLGTGDDYTLHTMVLYSAIKRDVFNNTQL